MDKLIGKLKFNYDVHNVIVNIVTAANHGLELNTTQINMSGVLPLDYIS